MSGVQPIAALPDSQALGELLTRMQREIAAVRLAQRLNVGGRYRFEVDADGRLAAVDPQTGAVRVLLPEPDTVPRLTTVNWHASNSAALGPAEAVCEMTNSATYRDGRAYRVSWGPNLLASVASVRIIVRIRKGVTTAGQVLMTTSYEASATAGQLVYGVGHAYFRNTSGADIDTPLAMTLQGSGVATVMHVAGGASRYLMVEEVGAAADYGFAINLV